MKGKAGLAIGIAVGYVLGSRAGRERYEQIRTQWQKVWNLEPVQEQVSKVADFAKSSAMSLPSTLWDSAVKVGKAASAKGTPGQRVDAAVKASKDAADDLERAADETTDAAAKAAEKAKKAAEEARDRSGA